MNSNTTGSGNTASGFEALLYNTTGSANTAHGSQALEANSTGSGNTAVGSESLNSNTSGNNNTASGVAALELNTTGSANTASGVEALGNNTVGYYNTANGYTALYLNTNGVQNTANGYAALYSNASGSENTADGIAALYSNTTGANNVALGGEALKLNTSGSANTAVGLQTLYNNNGDENTALGATALFSSTTGYNNTAVGKDALYASLSGYQNTAAGHGALRNNTTGTRNTALGDQALYASTNGNHNTVLGFQALSSSLTGDFNIGLGEGAGSSLTAGSYNIEIGTTGAANDNNTMRIGDPTVHTNTYISGIYNANPPGGVPVYINAFGQLGTSGTAVTNNQSGVTLTGTFSGDGEGLTLLNATNLWGTVADFHLSGNVGLRSGGNSFTGNQTLLSGFMGLGTSSPHSQLEVSGTSGIQERVTDTTSGNSLVFQAGSGNNMKVTGWNYFSNSAVPLYLSVDGANTILNSAGGRVGIGTSNPQSTLHVAGTVTAGTFIGNGAGLTNLPSASSGWQLGGNSGTTAGPNFVGTTDNQALELHVNGARGLRLEPNGSAPNVIGGASVNFVASGTLGAVIAGGGDDGFGPAGNTNYGHGSFIGGGVFNRIDANNYESFIGGGHGNTTSNSTWYATIGGGWQNQIQSGPWYSTIGGGWQNQIRSGGNHATTIAGGYQNIASFDGTVAGGVQNSATNYYATAGGGVGNVAGGERSTVAGGSGNQALNLFATIAGGENGSISGNDGTIGGGSGNSVLNSYGVVAGGHGNSAVFQEATVGGGGGNYAGGTAATVAGGDGNQIITQFSSQPDYSVIGGGSANSVSAPYATIGGGLQNVASAQNATVPGGYGNSAQGLNSFAAGVSATASDSGSFVMACGNPASSWGNNTFTVRCSGGARFYSINSGTGGVVLNGGGGSWSSLSDKNVKTNCVPVDAKAILEKVVSLPVATWSYKAQDPSIRHVGPMAQDFYASFNVGEDDTHITTIDEEGVALAAIQGLNQKLEEKQATIHEQENQITDLKERLERLEQLINAKNGGGN
ncbi:MAG: hypothetical protein C5B50_14225 [Verrucomicrobia bacterium]|nr:MAG: hypothetical protein C5B50_14225 [Verrucomicrobiota bacterium]